MSKNLLSPDAGWHLTLFSTAGEAGDSFLSSYRPQAMYEPPGSARDPERSRSVAARYARSKLRKYAAANYLDRFGTLTYRGSGCHDPAQAREDVAQFFRGLRAELGGEPFPYIWVPEWHKSDHGLHLHCALRRYVRHSLITGVRGHGFVSTKRSTGQKVGASRRDSALIAVGCLAKYVSKTFDAQDLSGMHRHEVAQGFQPVAKRFGGKTALETLGTPCEVMGGQPARSWISEDQMGWNGPPAKWYQWAWATLILSHWPSE